MSMAYPVSLHGRSVRGLVLILLLLVCGISGRRRGACTWRRLRWKQMTGYDDRRIWFVWSVERCKQLCLDEERFECRSLQHHSIRKLCRLSRMNTAMVPPWYVKFGFFNSVYEVNCEPVWGAWSAWSDCSTTCGKGIRTRTRECESFTGSGCRNMLISADATSCDSGVICPNVSRETRPVVNQNVS